MNPDEQDDTQERDAAEYEAACQRADDYCSERGLEE